MNEPYDGEFDDFGGEGPDDNASIENYILDIKDYLKEVEDNGN